MSVREGNITTLCGLLRWAQLIASRVERDNIWSTWRVEPYAELCSAVYDSSRLEEFASGDAENLGFTRGQASVLNEFLQNFDVLTDAYPPTKNYAEEVVESREWTALVRSAKKLLVEAEPWSDLYCVAEYDRLKAIPFED